MGGGDLLLQHAYLRYLYRLDCQQLYPCFSDGVLIHINFCFKFQYVTQTLDSTSVVTSMPTFKLPED